ncbi:DNA cytosine methyltransferase [Alkalicoccus chagannorensis]|uniref:DNA cytosine methyltransferase n=1 Tax=Alkalicoccus chagannorensis TaxID=427072 RepID=UPI00040943D3|nr:DNA cytosine methyltransferase [Alkalicoccus chagannorensis]
MPYAIDLFSGAGGMSEGLLQAGFHILFSSDINMEVEKTYKNRHHELGLIQGENTHFERADISALSGKIIYNKIRNLSIFQNSNIPDIDAIFGGPPCQGFSLAGRREKTDPRNVLFAEYVRVIADIEPKYVVMENVEGFLNTRLDNFHGLMGENYPENSLVSDILTAELESIGYVVSDLNILNASQFGVPQRRRRAIFIAHKENVSPPLFPEEYQPQISVGEAISDLSDHTPSLIPNSSYQKESREGRTPTVTTTTQGKLEFKTPLKNFTSVFNHEISKHSMEVKERFSLFQEGESNIDVRSRIRSTGIKNAIKKYPYLFWAIYNNQSLYRSTDELNRALANGNLDDSIFEKLLSKKNNRYRLDSNNIAPTVMTLPDDYIVPYNNRIPTVRELARLQSFDDSFEFLGKRTTGGPRRKVEVPQYSQVGNAVPPLLAKAIANEIKNAIKKTSLSKVN